MPLTDQEIETYHQDGLVIPSSYRVPRKILARINELYQKLLEDNKNTPDFSADFILGPHLNAQTSYGVKGDPGWLDFARISEILDMKEAAGSPHGYSNRALFLLRGEDRSGRNNFTRGHKTE